MAVGDALGTTLEDTHYSDTPKHVDMVGGGKFSLLPGQWTDGSFILILPFTLIRHHHGTLYG